MDAHRGRVRFALTIILPLLVAACSHVPEPNIASDEKADVSVEKPMFAHDAGPVVAIDSRHNNYHRIDGLFAPFASLLRNDGFRVVDSNAPFGAENLSHIDILAISNARPTVTAGDEAAPLSAFTSGEIDAVKTWILNGGSLLLIADHAPFAGSAAGLASAFGFEFEDVLVSRIPPGTESDIFSTEDGSLRAHIVTSGRDESEAVHAVQTFGGSAFRAPSEAQPLIVLPKGYFLRDCRLPCPDGAPKRDASGYLQGAVAEFGKGRVAVFGEAAMFSAQIAPRNSFRFGFNAPGAEQNKQLVLNVMRWLAGSLPE